MKRTTLLWILLLAALQKNAAQTSAINGFSCVTPGVPYQYLFNGGWDSSVSIQVCVNGGTISGEQTNCKTAVGINSVSITWNDSIATGSIQVSYLNKTINKTVSLTPLLNGGKIGADSKTQYADSTKMPADIICSSSTGGNCNPDYSYQWQASKDILNWKDIPAAKNKNLKFSSSVPRALYFRRKTIENNSGSIAYSDEAVVFLN